MDRLSALNRARLIVTLCVLVMAASLWIINGPFVFPLDDAYITLHNADAVWAGYDAAYRTSPLTGATSLLHLTMVALAAKAFPGVLGGFVVATFGAAAYGLATLEVVAQASLSWAMRAALVFLALLTGHTLFHLFNGLETAWAAASVALAIVLASREAPSRWLAVVCGLMPFLRPELAALAGLLMLVQASRRGGDWRGTLLDWLACAAAATPWVIWSWLQTGQPMPGTLGAKIAFFAEATLPLSTKLNSATLRLVSGLGPLVLGLVYLRRNRLGAALVLFVIVFLAAFVIAFPGGLAQNFGRYTLVLAPICIFGLARFAERRDRIVVIAIALMVGGIGLTLPRAIADLAQARGNTRDAFAARTLAEANIPAAQTVLVHDAGVISYRSKLRLVDVVGLKSPSSITPHRRWTLPSQGREVGKALDQIARQSGAGYFIDLRDGGFWGRLADALAREGWTLTPLSTGAGRYQIYWIAPPEGRSPASAASEMRLAADQSRSRPAR